MIHHLYEEDRRSLRSAIFMVSPAVDDHRHFCFGIPGLSILKVPNFRQDGRCSLWDVVVGGEKQEIREEGTIERWAETVRVCKCLSVGRCGVLMVLSATHEGVELCARWF